MSVAQGIVISDQFKIIHIVDTRDLIITCNSSKAAELDISYKWDPHWYGVVAFETHTLAIKDIDDLFKKAEVIYLLFVGYQPPTEVFCSTVLNIRLKEVITSRESIREIDSLLIVVIRSFNSTEVHCLNGQLSCFILFLV